MLHTFVGIIISLLMLVSAKEQWLFQSEKKWDKEWSSGAWTYQETVPVERARIAVIGGVFVPMFAPGRNASILEIGCGEGAVTDFLPDSLKAHYVGVDISKEAIMIAKTKRRPPIRFVHAAAHRFEPNHKFDIVIFSEVLYYTEYEKIIDQYLNYLNPKGVVIISIFQMEGKPKYENIFAYAAKVMDHLDVVDVSGNTKKNKEGTIEKTAFKIEVFRKK
jgi:2-polyprenyl-3-methyl-5-hydroxy-6-metoxy-1,4-benzoquinol methylase